MTCTCAAGETFDIWRPKMNIFTLASNPNVHPGQRFDRPARASACGPLIVISDANTRPLHACISCLLDVSVTCLCETCKLLYIVLYIDKYVYVVLYILVTFRTPTHTHLEAGPPAPPPFFVFVFRPPPHTFQIAGPHTRREIKNASPGGAGGAALVLLG